MTKKQKNSKKNKQAPIPSIPWTTAETRGFLTLAFAFILVLSLISFAVKPDAKNLIGMMGHSLGWIFHALLGLGSYFLAIYIGWIGWRLLFNKPLHQLFLKGLYMTAAIASICVLLNLTEHAYPHIGNAIGSAFYPGLWMKKQYYHLGGALLFYLYRDLPFYNLDYIFNTVGLVLIFSSIFIASLLFLFKINLSSLLQAWREKLKAEQEIARLKLEQQKLNVAEKQPEKIENKIDNKEESDFLRFVKLRIPHPSIQDAPLSKASSMDSPASDMIAIQPEKNPKVRPSISRKEQADTKKGYLEPELKPKVKESESPNCKRETALMAQRVHNGDFTHFVLPDVNLLSNPKKLDQSSLKKDIKRQAEVLEETLLSFGIEAKVGQINCGPTITSFEVHPAIGVKVQRIKSLENDIALNMEAKSIRIIAPIPGKAAVGIEVPNSQPQEVGFKDMLTAYQQESQKFHIPILLGKAVNGDCVMSDLAKMPHCIIAGATGSGKSVCINTIIMSIVMNAKPNQIKLIMVDPKKVELTPYTRLPHMLAPVITEAQEAAAALKWLVKEMENRYEILKLIGVRNIDSFNKRAINKDFEASLSRDIPDSMPYIVGIIDELADLMMVASQDIETPIARIAQMARAVGIHLILATQRPSREVITGIIKANFPTRISFKVASRVNSQIVLDETGAESLLGNGDMLFLPPGSSHLIRAQGAFIRDEDIQNVIDQICHQAPPNYVIQSFDQLAASLDEGSAKNESLELDSLYNQAKDIVLSTGNASTTFLQRKLKIGYARAASLMDQLEMQGIVGPAEGSKPRKIFGRKAGTEDNATLNEEEKGFDHAFEKLGDTL